MQSFPHHENNEEGGSPLDLKVAHKCNESTQELKDGGWSTWCPAQEKKHPRPIGKKEWSSEQKAMHSPLGPIGLFVHQFDSIYITYHFFWFAHIDFSLNST